MTTIRPKPAVGMVRELCRGSGPDPTWSGPLSGILRPENRREGTWVPVVTASRPLSGERPRPGAGQRRGRAGGRVLRRVLLRVSGLSWSYPHPTSTPRQSRYKPAGHRLAAATSAQPWLAGRGHGCRQPFRKPESVGHVGQQATTHMRCHPGPIRGHRQAGPAATTLHHGSALLVGCCRRREPAVSLAGRAFPRTYAPSDRRLTESAGLRPGRRSRSRSWPAERASVRSSPSATPSSRQRSMPPNRPSPRPTALTLTLPSRSSGTSGRNGPVRRNIAWSGQ